MAVRKFKAIKETQFRALLGPNPQVLRSDGKVYPTGEVVDGQGLVLVIGTGSQRSWLLNYRFGGKARDIGLGSAHVVGLARAREAAETARLLVKDGVDPKAVKDEKANARRAETNKVPEKSFAKLAYEAVKNPEVCNLACPKARKEWADGLQPHLCGGITAKAPRDITRADVAAVVTAIRERGRLIMAQRIQARMKAVFEWCAGNGYIDENAVNPAHFEGRHRMMLPRVKAAKAHQAAIPWRSAPDTIARLRIRQPRLSSLCCEWIMLSAVRPGNGCTARWADIDREAMIWTIPAAEMKEDGHGVHRVPLTTRHIEILDEIVPPLQVNPSPFLFPGETASGFDLGTVRKALRAVYPHLITRLDGSKRYASVHGLRATFRTWGANQLAEGGGPRYDEQLLELCLAHVVGDAARNAYVQENNVELRRAIMTAWASFLRDGANVVAFPKVA